MISFDAAHRAVHYPHDRRFRIWIRPSILIGIGVAILAVVARGLDRVCRGRPASYSTRSPDISQRLRRAARVSALGSLLPLLQFPFCDDADSQRSVHPGGSSASVFQ